MTSGRVRKWGVIALTVLLVVIVGCPVGFVEGIRITKQKGWPAAEELRAASCGFGAFGDRPRVSAA